MRGNPTKGKGDKEGDKQDERQNNSNSEGTNSSATSALVFDEIIQAGSQTEENTEYHQ